MNPELASFYHVVELIAPYTTSLGLAILALTHSWVVFDNKPRKPTVIDKLNYVKYWNQFPARISPKRESIIHDTQKLMGRIKGAQYDRQHGLHAENVWPLRARVAILDVLYHASYINHEYESNLDNS